MSFSKMILASTVVFAFAAHADKASDKVAVDNACTAEATTAGCGSEKVGTGLLKCIHAYKMAHKEFKLSDGCKASMKQLRSDRKKSN